MVQGLILGSATANANGYDGSTQIAAVADTGLGGGSAASAHPDLPATRITEIQSLTIQDAAGCYQVVQDGAQDGASGHGTHVALSVVGSGDANGVGKAAASAANLVFQSVEDYISFEGQCSDFYGDGYYLIGIPSNLGTLFGLAYAKGARIHANSWGSNSAGAYTSDSASADAFIWSHPDMLVTFSAGNSGADSNGDGVVDADSIGSPATAKNVLTVGASETSVPTTSPVTAASLMGATSTRAGRAVTA